MTPLRAAERPVMHDAALGPPFQCAKSGGDDGWHISPRAWRPPVPKGMRGGPRRFSLASPFLSQDFCHHPNVSNLGEKRRGDRYSEVVNPAKGYGFIQPANGGK